MKTIEAYSDNYGCIICRLIQRTISEYSMYAVMLLILMSTGLLVKAQPAVTFDPFTVSTLAGSGVAGYANGTGTAAQFYTPNGVAADASGNVYVADLSNNRIRKITSAGVVTTLAGSGVAGFANGTGTAAEFNHPTSVCVSNTGIIYVADNNNNRIRKITAAGVVTTLAGSGVAGFANGTGTAAQFNSPYGVCTDAAGNVYVADQYTERIRKITPAGVVTTLAGNGTQGDGDGSGSGAQFNEPNGVAADAAGNIYVTQFYGRLRKVTSAGVVTTIMASALTGFNQGVCTDAAGNVYVTLFVAGSGSTSTIVKVTPSYASYILAGGANGYANGFGTSAKFNSPVGITADNAGNLYVADNGNNRIRKIAIPTLGNFTTTTGTPSFGQYFRISGVHLTTNEVVTAPAGFEVSLTTGSGFASSLSFMPASAEVTNKKIYVRLSASAAAGNYSGNITLSSTGAPNKYLAVHGTVSPGVSLASVNFDPIGVTTLAGSGAAGFVNATGTAAQFNLPYGAAVDATGNVYVTDNNRIRKITPAGVVTTFAGSGVAGYANGTGAAAQFNAPQGLCVDASGNVYVADNNRIRKITPAAVVTTLAGNGTIGFVNGPGTSAEFNYANTVCADASGNIYVSDQYNNCVRKVTPAGVVSTLAGGTSGDADGTGSGAQFGEPNGVAADGAGNIYVTQFYGSLRKITPAGVVTTIYSSAVYGFNNGVAADAEGNVFVSIWQYVSPDVSNNYISKVTPGSNGTILAGNTNGFLNGNARAAKFNNPIGVAVDATGNLYVADYNNNRIRKISVPKLSPFKTTQGTPSGGQYFRVSGIRLTGNEVVTAPPGYEISLTAGSGYTSGISLIPVSGEVVYKQIYIRLKGTASAGTYNGNISLVSTGAATKYLAVTGTVTGPAFNASLVMDESIQVYPNPNKGSFSLQLNNLDASALEVRVTGQDGKIILQQKLNGLSKTQTIPLNTGEVANGIYTVQAIGNNKVYTVKMVVQH